MNRPDPIPSAGVVHRQSSEVAAQVKAAAADSRVISLCGALPAAELFPSGALDAAAKEVMAGGACAVLQYGWPEGLDRLRTHIVAWMKGRGVELSAEQILVTHGAQQALHLLGRLLVPEGAPVAVEVPTYSAALQSLDLRQPRYIGVPRTAAGIDLPALERAVSRGRAKVLYLVASGHNPTGGVLDATERREVLDIAERFGTWIIDDDAYGALVYGEAPPSLLQCGRHVGRIAHVGSFSKVLAPGLRVGWIAASKELVAEATLLKQAQDLETAQLTQGVLARWLDHNSLSDHIDRCLPVYRARRDALRGALESTPLPDTSWECPSGGFSLLLWLPAGMDADALVTRGIADGVLVEAASPYFARKPARDAIRLSYSNVAEEKVEEGIRRLAKALRASLSTTDKA